VEGDEIETYLQALNRELQKRTIIKKPVRLAIVGGVYMMNFVHNRSSTKDIDVVPLDFPDTMNPDEETKAFQTAIRAVARAYHIKQNWMNDVVAAFIPKLGEPITLWKEYSHLHVYAPPPDYILALKLLAGREKDAEDIEALCSMLNVETREQAQAIVDRYADKRWQQECNLQATLGDLFEI
jgi:hypothetical protein